MTPAGRLLRQLRESAGISQAQLAAASGVALSEIGAIEEGGMEPSGSTVIALAKALKTNAFMLMTGKAYGELSDAAREACELFDRVSPEVQGAVLGLLNALKKTRPPASSGA